MKKLLVLNFFPAFTPPTSGGELRYFNIYNHLSEHFDVTLLSPTYAHHKLETIEHSKNFREYRIPKEEIHNNIQSEIYNKQIGEEFSALVCALSAQYPNNYHHYFNKLYKDSDIIIHESPYMIDYDIYAGIDSKPRIYNSYNHESYLMEQIWKGENANVYINYIRELEKKTALKCDLIFTTSAEEKEKFTEDFNLNPHKVKIVPNGINPEDFDFHGKETPTSEKKILFMGSQHPPNTEAVKFIFDELVNKLQNIEFTIAGSCCSAFKNYTKSNVKLIQNFNEKEKKELLQTADIFINPMFSGAGTNLKTIEALAAGLPLIATSIGARGLNLEDKKHFILAEKDNFSDKILELTKGNELQKRISLEGKKYINENYSWSNISNNIKNYIDTISPKTSKRTKILLLNNFEVSNPRSGGAIRINKLYENLVNTGRYTVTLLCFSNDKKLSMQELSNNFFQISIPRTKEHISKQTSENNKFWISTSDITDSDMCNKNELFVSIVKNLHEQTDITIFSHPYLIKLADILSKKPIIYESHNSEVELKKTTLNNHPNFNNLILQVENLESAAINKSDFIISVSECDSEKLIDLSRDKKKEIEIISNGTDIPELVMNQKSYDTIKKIFDGHMLITFIGSSHKPNINALKFIISDLAPSLPNCYFSIIGSVCSAYEANTPKNVLMFGEIDELHKNILLKISDIAINPMKEGSGSNLKLAEYLANNLPVITTPTGARGYNINNNEGAVICELNKMKESIIELIKNKRKRDTIAKNGHEYAMNTLTWPKLASKLDNCIEKRYSNKKKILIVTYRFTNPPKGGAESYLLNTIKELNKYENIQIDITTTDIAEIYNIFHFATETTSIKNEKDNSLENVNIYRFPTNHQETEDIFNDSCTLFEQWMKESIKISMKFIEHYDLPIILGGWHYPEKHEDSVYRWSSNESYISTKNTNSLTCEVYTPSKKKITIRDQFDNILFEGEIQGTKKITFETRNSDIIKITTNISSAIKNKDSRPLGILWKSIKYEVKEKLHNIDLNYDFRDYVKENFLEKYIEELIEIANSRPSHYDDIFQQLRGPNSKELENWLNKNIIKYDYVIAHGVPFKTIVTTSSYCKIYEKKCIVLPHFHIEDEFYHWNSYYDSFKNSYKTLTAPKSAIELFFKKISNNTIEIAGGGLDESEYLNVDSEQFLKKYDSRKPFFLVLGRKTGTKNYKTIINTIDSINLLNEKCKLVMIGKDEDMEKIKSNHVIYLREQPREVVLGALKECLGVINMSSSESFGIVILEAWMNKKPVIANINCTAFRDLIENEIDGLLTDEKNLEENMLLILNDTDKARNLGLKGHEKCKKYTWKEVAKTIKNLII